MPEVYEGVVEDLIAKHNLRGLRVKITVLEQPASADIPRISNQLDELMAWAERHKFTGPSADDSRESIYTSTIDDTR